MNTHLHRKQIVIFALAMMLAAASYWIPLPHQKSGVSSSSSQLFSPIGRAALEEAIVYSREPATIWRFSVAVRAPQAPIQTAKPLAEDVKPVPSLPKPRLISRRDFTNGDRTFLLAPVKGLDLPLKR